MKKDKSLTTNASEIKMCGIKAGCLSHTCQDAIAMHQFVDAQGENVYVGAVSDGCSGALGTEFGSDFIAKAFIAEAEKLGKKGNRDSAYIRKVILAVSERLAEYKPVLSGSKIIRTSGVETCEEQIATLYGFVADSSRILLALAGDGEISINDNCVSMSQQNGDVYPVWLLSFPKKEWASRIEDLYAFEEIETKRVQSLIIATDGFGCPNPEEYPGLSKNPAMFVLHAYTHATEYKPFGNFPGAQAFRGGDDTTAIVLGTGNVNNLLSRDDVEKIATKTKRLGSNGFLKDLGKVPEETIRNSAYKDKLELHHGFERSINPKEDVQCIGITDQDKKLYSQQRSYIFESRVYETNSLEILFGALPAKNPQRKTTPKTQSIAPQQQIQGAQIQVTDNSKSEKTSNKSKQPLIAKATSKAKRKKNKTAPKSEWIPFEHLCNYRSSVKLWIGFRHFPFIATALWDFIQGCHNKGWRFGNLRPQDLEFKTLELRSKEPQFEFRLSNLGMISLAKVSNTDTSILEQNYLQLDKQFIHPRYLDRLLVDDDARIDHAWFCYKTLLFWVFIKADPFGEGKVKDNPDADRIYRMENKIYCTNKSIDMEKSERDFIFKATQRLNNEILSFIKIISFNSSIRDDASEVVNAFKNSILKCDNMITKKGHFNLTRCNFSRLGIWSRCPQCNHSKMQAISNNQPNAL